MFRYICSLIITCAFVMPATVVHAQTAPAVARASTTLNYSTLYTSPQSGSATVKKETLGTVYTTFNLFPNYQKAIAPIENYSLRWPGGSFAETNAKYSLKHADIYDEPATTSPDYNRSLQRGLTEMLAYTREQNIPFVMIIPTRPYFNNVAQGQTDVRNFMIRLLRGDFGELPASITLEIGNETQAFGWKNGRFTPGPSSYGFVANAFLTTINSVLNDATLNPKKRRVDTAIWIGSTTGGMPNIYNQITAANMKSVDGFVHHIGLVENNKEYDFALTNQKFGVARSWWSRAWGGRNVPEMRIIATEWNVGSCADPATPAEYKKYDIGARQGPTVVDTFSKMIGGGLDMGMLWGNQTCQSQMLWHDGERLSHGGEAFRLMSESLPGTQLVSGKVNTSGIWTRSGTNFDVIGYRDASKMVVFISAGDIPPTGLDVNVTLTNFGTIKSITTETVRTKLTQPGDPSTDDDRMYEEPVVSTGTLTPKGSTFTYRLTQDYELARVIVNR